MKWMKYIGISVLLIICRNAAGQKFSVSTNALGYANLCTLNLEASYAVAQHWSIAAGAKYNPFAFSRKGGTMQNKQQAYALGARFWFWHIYSGWWIAAKMQYQEYNSGGMFSVKTEEGDRFGAGITAGYTYMIHPKLNMEFGFGLWAGMKKYVVYNCPKCGITIGSGRKGFLLPNDIIIGISYVF